MAVFRVERNKGYTVMSNHHLRNKELSLKAKGLLSQMLSLPEDWDYTLKGLSKVKTKVAFNLTKRQIVCFAAALLFGLPLFFLLKDSTGICLLRMFLSFRLLSPTTEKKRFCQTYAKEKRCNLKKDYNAF